MEDPLQQPAAPVPDQETTRGGPDACSTGQEPAGRPPEETAGGDARAAPSGSGAVLSAGADAPVEVVPDDTASHPLLFLLASRLEGWLATNRAPLIVIGIALAFSIVNDALCYPVAHSAAANADTPQVASTAMPLNPRVWAGIGMAILVLGGAVASLGAAVSWFAVPEARAWLRSKLQTLPTRHWPALRLADLIAVFMVYFSALRVLALNLLVGTKLESGARMAWSMLINGTALFLALTFGISLARHRAHGFHGSYGIWPFWRLAAGSRPRSLWQDIALGVLAYPLMLWAMHLAMLVNQQFVQSIGKEQDQHILFRELTKPQPAWVLMVFLAMATFGAALLEELLFRGILYNTLRRYLGAAASACFAALIFAAFHEVWSQFLGLFVLALVLTWLYDHTGRLVASMTLHLVNNLVALVVTIYGQQAGV